MKHPRHRHAKVGKQAKPVVFRLKDKLQLAGLIFGMLAATFVFEHYYWTHKAAAALETRLSQWQRLHNLTDDQVNRLRAIEREYHGSGNPLLTPAHSLADEHGHSQLLRDVMKLGSTTTARAPAIELP